MSCLVNFYVVTPKKEWEDIILSTEQKDRDLILSQVPEKYHPMLKALLTEFKYLNSIMDNRYSEVALKIYDVALEHETEDTRFDTRYHDESLFQILRKTFYNTLAAISNDFNWDKYNYCRVASPEELILEEMDVIINEKVVLKQGANLERQEV
jgi:hypothetical protein